MDYHQKFRKEYSHLNFETRVLPEINGLSHVITLDDWYWTSLDLYIKDTAATLESITEFCIEHAHMKSKRDNIEFDRAFYEAFTYYIYIGFSKIYKIHKNIANDFWK